MGHLQVSNLGKAYKRYRTQRARLSEWLTVGAVTQHTQNWVLRGISFEIRSGEAVGIIGRNGAGKSTLLKLITGTTQPSCGTVEVGGHVAALLELGMGFHPDFTGRQNVLTAGQLLGHSGKTINRKMEEIEAFAEIGQYIDQPVRTYSSGMQVRLAFSVATAFRPNILVVDEALSVGDAYFQHKSFARIRQFKDEGTTLLFVSHNAGAVKTLCDRAILLDDGLMIQDGRPDTVLDYYNALIAKQEADSAIRQIEDRNTRQTTTRSGNRWATIQAVDILENGRSVRAIRCGDRITLFIVFEVSRDITDLTVGILIRDKLGNNIFGTNTQYLGVVPRQFPRGTRTAVEFVIPSLGLGVGNYNLTVALHSGETHLQDNYDWWDRALVFQVVPGDGARAIGVCNMPLAVNWVDVDTAEGESLARPQNSEREI